MVSCVNVWSVRRPVPSRLVTCPQVDLNIIYTLLTEEIEFCMEVTDRTRADVQGGVLTECDGRPKLVEAIQVPQRHLGEFNSLKRFPMFNTNNLWVSCKAVQVRAFFRLHWVAGSSVDLCAPWLCPVESAVAAVPR